MRSENPEKRSNSTKPTIASPSKKRKRVPLKPEKTKKFKKTKSKSGNSNCKKDSKTLKTQLKKNENNENSNRNKRKNEGRVVVENAMASQQLRFFIDQFQSASGIQLSSLELEAIKETCIVEPPQGLAHDVATLGDHMKAAFGSSWKEALCDKKLSEGEIEPGSPALLIISSSALRSCDLVRGLRSLTKECCAAKLFSKVKVEEQVSFLKNRVNIACGTPSRIKRLIDMEALGLSRLALIVLDMHVDAKGYSLFTLPQVREEFWDLYKSYFHQGLAKGNLRICLYGPISDSFGSKKNVEIDS